MPVPPVEGHAKVFVYGSLRRGQVFRHVVEPFVVSERAATIRGDMYHFAAPGTDRGPYPYVCPGAGTVHGEVLELRDAARALAVLDALEDCPQVYVRTLVRATYADGGSDWAHAYFIRPGAAPPGRRVASGDWLHEAPEG